VWLPEGDKCLMICLAISTQYRRVTDRQTDLRRHRQGYAYASRGKNHTVRRISIGLPSSSTGTSWDMDGPCRLLRRRYLTVWVRRARLTTGLTGPVSSAFTGSRRLPPDAPLLRNIIATFLDELATQLPDGSTSSQVNSYFDVHASTPQPIAQIMLHPNSINLRETTADWRGSLRRRSTTH